MLLCYLVTKNSVIITVSTQTRLRTHCKSEDNEPELWIRTLNPDPDPAFQKNPDPDPKIKGKKLNFLFSFFFDKKIAIYLSLGLEMTSKLQEKPSALKREHQALQKMKYINFFLFLCVTFALLDPDRKSGYGSRDPIESGSTTLE
jgi:hypothetical protein